MKTSPVSLATLVLAVLVLLCVSSWTPGSHYAVVVMADEEEAAAVEGDPQEEEIAPPDAVAEEEEAEEEAPPPVDCESFCMPRINGVIANWEASKAEMQESVNSLTAQWEKAMASSAEKNDELRRLTGQVQMLEDNEGRMKEGIAELRSALDESKKQAEEGWASAASHASTIKALEGELAKVREEMLVYSDSRIYINWELLKSDGKALMKKLGFGKEEL
jgi:hypothetical protein